MNPRTTGILFVLAMALGAFVYFYEIRGEEGRREAEEAGKRVFLDLDAADVSEIELTTSDGADARLERRDDGWRVVAPVDFPADDVTADGMAGALSKLGSEGSIEEPQPPQVYGLGEDARVLRFRADGAEHTLRIGKKTPVGANSYVSRDGDPAVHMVQTWRLNSFKKTLDEVRDRRVLQFDRNAVQAIAVRWPDGGVRLERTGDGWVLREPVEGPADEDTVEDLLSELAFLRAEGFVDEPLDDAAAGLDPPELEVVLALRRDAAGTGDAGETGDGGETGGAGGSDATGPAGEARLVLGGVRSEGDRLARGSGPALYRIAANRIDDLPHRLIDYRFKQLASFDPADARRFEIDFAGPEALSVVGERDGDDWRTTPESMESGSASALVGELSRLEASDIVADAVGEAELAGLGLAPPRVRFRVLGEPGEDGSETVLADVALGALDPARGVIARRNGEGPIYRMDHELAEHLPVSVEAFRNRFVAKPQPGGTADDTDAPDDASDGPISLDESD